MNLLELKNISKTFGTFKANDAIHFNVLQGEIHAILGENGAGKSTLMKIIYGEYQPDNGGEIFLKEKKVVINSPKEAIDLGIGMVHQHFRLVDDFTILQNIILGIEPRNFLGIIDYSKARKKLEQILKTYQFDIDLDAKIEDVSVGTQQRVEILKTLYRESNILIFDEPTAVLTPQEVQEFYKIIFNLKAEGKTVLVITHKLNEIKTIADRCTILRKGKYIETCLVANTSQEELAAKMVGKSVNLKVHKNEIDHNQEVILTINDLCVSGQKKNIIDHLSLSLKKGHITGIAGIDGNGQSELVEALCGLRKADSGSIQLKGKELFNHNPKFISEAGISLVPEDRHRVGLVLEMSVADNLVLRNFEKVPFSNSYGKIITEEIDRFACEMIERFKIRTPDHETLAKNLSGGNQQKIILAREISSNPDVLIAFQPTRGLDVGAISFVHEELVKLRDAGKAILLISYELDEIINLSDDIFVIYKGKTQTHINPQDFKSNDSDDELKEKIGFHMSGGRKEINQGVKQ